MVATSSPADPRAMALRLLIRNARYACLSSLMVQGGIPYGSLVNLATTETDLPFVLLSRLAWHTQNLLADHRASLLVTPTPLEPEGGCDVLTCERVTILGRMILVPAPCPTLRARYLASHPQAASYIDFADFNFWRMVPEQVHGVAGFGRIETYPALHVFPLAP